MHFDFWLVLQASRMLFSLCTLGYYYTREITHCQSTLSLPPFPNNSLELYLWNAIPLACSFSALLYVLWHFRYFISKLLKFLISKLFISVLLQFSYLMKTILSNWFSCTDIHEVCRISKFIICNYTIWLYYFSGLMCVDKRKSCPSWASQGDCKTNGWTESNCRISCKTRCDTHPVKPAGK